MGASGSSPRAPSWSPPQQLRWQLYPEHRLREGRPEVHGELLAAVAAAALENARRVEWLEGETERLYAAELEHDLDAVEAAGGNVSEAARRLDLHPNYLHRLITNLGLRDEVRG